MRFSLLILAFTLISCQPGSFLGDPKDKESKSSPDGPAGAKDASPSESEGKEFSDSVIALLQRSKWEWVCDSADSADTSSRLVFEDGKLFGDVPTVWGRQCDFDPSNDYDAPGEISADAMRAEFSYTIEKIPDLDQTYKMRLVLIKTERSFLNEYNANQMNRPKMGGTFGFDDWKANEWKQINGLDQGGYTKETGSTDYAYEVGEEFLVYMAVIDGKLYVEGMAGNVYDLYTSYSREEDVDPWTGDPGKREKFWENELYRRTFKAL